MAEKMGPDFLSEVQAVAMDMNASYNLLVKEHLPNAQNVYDRFHMQAQFGKEVLGVVRLAQTREHNTKRRCPRVFPRQRLFACPYSITSSTGQWSLPITSAWMHALTSRSFSRSDAMK